MTLRGISVAMAEGPLILLLTAFLVALALHPAGRRPARWRNERE
jgi:hypothetical protein